MQKQTKKVVVLTGGGSGGPVSPLLALAETVRKHHPKTHFFFIGTSGGVEQDMVKRADISFVGITAARLRRYWSIRNVFAPFKLIVGFLQAYRILKALNPEYVVGAGGFVQVPVAYAAWVLSIPVFIHQQDVLPGLANKLCAPIARRITVTFRQSLEDFPQGWTLHHLRQADRVVWTGNPVRHLVFPSRVSAHKHYRLDPEYPTVLIMGGGTGALALNKLVLQNVEGLTHFFNVIHITGRGKKLDAKSHARYRVFEFIHEMEYAYAAADLVVSRAGLSTITELAEAKKPAILVPLPYTHQEDNAVYLGSEDAALILDQTVLTPHNFASFLRSSLFDHELLKTLSRSLHRLMPRNANEAVRDVIEKALKS